MARLEIEIGAINDELKRVLEDSKNSLNSFDQATRKGGSSLSNLSKVSKETQRALDKQYIAQEKSKTATLRAREASAQLTLENRKNRTAVTGAAGSYREAQQRLTALGKTIRETAGGFNTSNPIVQRQVKEYRELNGQLKAFDKTMGLNYRNVGNYSDALSGVAPGLMRIGTVAGGVGAAFAALNDARKTIFAFDSGMRNVEKTTGLARKEVDALGVTLVNMSRRLQVVSTQKLTEYATVAGQLGIKGTKDISNFTEALAKLETATDITGEEGGKEIARTLTLVDGGVQNIKAFGDEIVNLGNNFAATEKEILSNAETIAQNVGIYKIGRQDVLAFATATKSVGIEAELVGSSFNRTLATFERMIRSGKTTGTVLETLGGTQAELATRFKRDAAGVYVDIVRALNNVDKAGGNVNDELDKLGIRAVRDRRVIQSLATNGFDVLTRAIDTSRDSTGALDSEFSVQSGKLEQQTGRVKIAWDNLVLSIENGTGAVGKFSVAATSALATVLESITDIITSESWEEFFIRLGQLSGSSATRGLASAMGTAYRFSRNADGQEQTGLVQYKELRDFRKASLGDKLKELDAQREIFELHKKEYLLDKTNIKKRDNLLYNAELMARMQSAIGAEGGADALVEEAKKTGDKIKSAIGKPINISDILGDLKAEDGNYYDKKLYKIGQEYEKLVKKIKTATGSQADISKALGLAAAKKDFDELKVSVERYIKEVKKIKPMNTAATSGSITTPSDLPLLEKNQRMFNDIRSKSQVSTDKDDDKLQERLSKVVERGFRNGLADLFNSIDDLGGNFYDVFSNVFGKLSSSVAKLFNDVLATQLGNMFKSSIDDLNILGLGNTGSKALIGGIGALGGILSAQGVKRGSSLLSIGGGALSGAAAGTAILPGIGTAIGAVVGGLAGLFQSKAAKKQERIQEEILAEQRKQTAIQNRMAALTFMGSIVGQQTNQGIITGADRNEFGDVTFRIQGRDLVASFNREEEAQKRGF